MFEIKRGHNKPTILWANIIPNMTVYITFFISGNGPFATYYIEMKVYYHVEQFKRPLLFRT